MSDDTYQIWVCDDCLFADVNGDLPDDAERAAELWQLLDNGGEHATLGLLWSEHADDCPNRAAEEWEIECTCEQRDFSWSPCAACGSRLGGHRHAYTVWPRETEPHKQ